MNEAVALQARDARSPERTGVEVRNLVKTYPGQVAPAVDGVSFSLPAGDMLALLGPSGCGKTTILRMIAGLIEPTSGSIQLGDREVSTIPVHKRGIGMVFQAYALFPHMTIAENVGFGLEMRGIGRDERQARVQAALDMVQLGDKGNRRIGQLSGGQQQRAALARSLVIEPSVLLLDEPLSNLDAKLRDEMRIEIRDIQSRTGITTLFVTHDQDEALSMADHIALMSAGRIEQIGTPEDLYDRPASRFVANFIGASNFLDARATSPGRASVEGLGQIVFSGNAVAGEKLTLLIRPHRIDMFPRSTAPMADNCFDGIIEDCAYTGDAQSCVVRAGAVTLKAEIKTRGTGRFKPGDEVTLTCDADDVTVLPS